TLTSTPPERKAETTLSPSTPSPGTASTTSSPAPRSRATIADSTSANEAAWSYTASKLSRTVTPSSAGCRRVRANTPPGDERSAWLAETVSREAGPGPSPTMVMRIASRGPPPRGQSAPTPQPQVAPGQYADPNSAARAAPP